jgi:hypothetical protein
MYIKFNVTFTNTGVTSTAVGTSSSFLYGSAYSFFRFVRLSQNGNADLENLQEDCVFCNIMRFLTLEPEERVASSVYTGDNALTSYSNSVAGLLINYSNATGFDNLNCSFCLPFYSLITNCSQFIPIFGPEIEYEFGLSTLSDIVKLEGANGPTSYSVSNFELITDALQCSQEGYNHIMRANGNPSVLSLKSETYLYSSSSFSAGASGRRDIIFPFQATSMKSLLINVWPANSLGGKFSGVNPNLRSYSLYVEGNSNPSYEIQYENTYAEPQVFNRKNLNSLYSTGQHSGVITNSNFRKASTAYGTLGTNYKAYDTTASALLNDTATRIPDFINTASSRSNMFYIYHDLEKIMSSKQSLYAGQKLSGSSSSLIRFDIHTALAAQVHNVNFFCVVDCLIQIDMETGLITVKK